MDISISCQKTILDYFLTSYSIVFYNSINIEYHFQISGNKQLYL